MKLSIQVIQSWVSVLKTWSNSRLHLLGLKQFSVTPEYLDYLWGLLILAVFSHSVMSDSLLYLDYSPPGSAVHGILQARLLEWVAKPSFRGFFPTQGSTPSLQHCRQILHHLSHQRSPFMLTGLWLLSIFSPNSRSLRKILLSFPTSVWLLSFYLLKFLLCLE